TTNLKCLGLLSESLGKLIVDALLNVDPVGTDASLTRASELGGNSTGNSSIEVLHIIKHDERSVASKLTRHLLDRRGGLLHEQPTDIRRSSEGDLADIRVGCDRFTHFRRVP